MLTPYSRFCELIPHTVTHLLTLSRNSSTNTCRGFELKTMERTTLALGQDFLEKHAVDETSKLVEQATYHGNNVKSLRTFSSDMTPVRDLAT